MTRGCETSSCRAHYDHWHMYACGVGHVGVLQGLEPNTDICNLAVSSNALCAQQEHGSMMACVAVRCMQLLLQHCFVTIIISNSQASGTYHLCKDGSGREILKQPMLMMISRTAYDSNCVNSNLAYLASLVSCLCSANARLPVKRRQICLQHLYSTRLTHECLMRHRRKEYIRCAASELLETKDMQHPCKPILAITKQ